MHTKNNWKNSTTKSVWQLRQQPLAQTLHVEQVIATHNPISIGTNFSPWQKYTRGNQPWNMMLLAYPNWITLQEIAKEVDECVSSMVFVAVNKYMLLPTVDPALDSDYNIAIRQVLEQLLINYQVVDYQYHAQERGNVGNFIVPDNRFLCKKV
jgi:hypothetical protein